MYLSELTPFLKVKGQPLVTFLVGRLGVTGKQPAERFVEGSNTDGFPTLVDDQDTGVEAVAGGVFQRFSVHTV
jgi:hypothetical protein